MSNPGSGQVPLNRAAHIPVLDGIRGIAILMVMVFHFLLHEPLPNNHILRSIFSLSHIGQSGVDLFFVLSGFLITGILLDTREAPHYFRDFYMRRTLRIFPLYYGILAVYFGILPLIGWLNSAVDRNNQLWLWLYGTNIALFLGKPMAAGHFWSLAVEEHFYLLWPAVVYWASKKTLLRICLGCIAFAMATRTVLTFFHLNTFFLTPCRIDALAIGGMFALLVRQPSGIGRIAPLCRKLLIPLALIMLLLHLGVSGERIPFVQIFKYTLIAGLFGVLLIVAVAADPESWTGWFFAHPALRFAGKISYGMYVYHGLLNGEFDRYFGIAKLTKYVHFYSLAMILKILLSSTITILISWGSWHLYEKWFLKLKIFFNYKAKKKTSPIVIEAVASKGI